MIDQHDLQAKSDQMNAVDLVHPMTFKIERVEYNPKQQQPIKLHLEGYKGRPYKPCKSMLRGLAHVWSMDEKMWQGRLIELYCDNSVKWAGENAGGIRISAVSGISEPFDLIVRLNRSQREIQTWNVISEDKQVSREFVITHYEADINEAQTDEDITAILKTVKSEFGAEEMHQLKDIALSAREKLGGKP